MQHFSVYVLCTVFFPSFSLHHVTLPNPALMCVEPSGIICMRCCSRDECNMKPGIDLIPCPDKWALEFDLTPDIAEKHLALPA